MTNKKYEFVDGDTITTPSGKTLRRIRALAAIGLSEAAGDLGGYIESEKNLSTSGNAWVYGNAQVYGDAQVYGNAQVYGDARVYGDAWVYGDARVSSNARVYGDAQVSGNAWVYGDAQVYGNAWVYGDAQVYGNAWVYGNARVSSNARVKKRSDIFWASIVGSENGTLTVMRGKDGLIVARGCFCGSVEKFLEASAKKHDAKIRREYELLIEVAKSRIGVDK